MDVSREARVQGEASRHGRGWAQPVAGLLPPEARGRGSGPHQAAMMKCCPAPTPTPASAIARDEAVDILVREPCLLSLLWGRFPGVEALSQSFKSFIVIDVVTSLA